MEEGHPLSFTDSERFDKTSLGQGSFRNYRPAGTPAPQGVAAQVPCPIERCRLTCAAPLNGLVGSQRYDMGVTGNRRSERHSFPPVRGNPRNLGCGDFLCLASGDVESLAFFVVPKVFAAVQINGVVVGESLVPAQETQKGKLGAGVDYGEQIVQKHGVAVMKILPAWHGEFPHSVMYPAGRGNAKTEHLVEDVEPLVPLLRPAAGRKLQHTVCRPVERIMLRHYEIQVSVKADFTCFHLLGKSHLLYRRGVNHPRTCSNTIEYNT